MAEKLQSNNDDNGNSNNIGNNELFVYLSYPLQSLADKLMSNVKADATGNDLFEPPIVIVPNRNMKRWLQMYLAAHGYVTAHIRFMSVEEGLRWLFFSIKGDSSLQEMRSVDWQTRILWLLLDDDAKDTPHWPILTKRETRAGTDRLTFLFQLSQKLTELFSKYEFHRLSAIEKWQSVEASDSLDSFGDSHFVSSIEDEPLFREQQSLYLAVTRDYADEVASASRRLHSQPFSTLVRRICKAEATLKSGRCIHLFGLSLLSRYHISLFRKLADYYQFRIYQPNLMPSILTKTEIKPETNIDNTGGWLQTELKADIPLRGVARWSRPFVESLQLLSAAFSNRIVWMYQPEHHYGRLTPFHRSMIDGSRLENTDVVQIGRCQGADREVETVYQCILDALKKDDTLLLTDIVVLVPNIDEYRPYIIDVFERERDDDGRPLISYNLSDYSAAIDSFYARGVELFFTLLQDDLTRSGFFELLYNPCCQEALHINKSIVDEWLQLFTDTNIFRYYDANDRASKTAVIADGQRSDAFTFLRGLRQIYLGLFSEPDQMFAGLRPHPLLLVDRSGLFRLFRLVQQIEEAKTYLQTNLAGVDRRNYVLELIDQWLAIPQSRQEEAQVRSKMRAEILAYNPALYAEHPRLLEQAALSSLTGIQGGRGNYLADGVTICSLQPMRPIPFRYVFVIGLGEGQFPQREDRSTLDLLNLERLHRLRDSADYRSDNNLPFSDISAGDRARLLLYETIFSAGEKVTLLYNGRDTKHDRDLLPCSPLQELVSAFELQDHVVTLPLKLYSSEYLNPADGLMVNLSGHSIRILNLRRQAFANEPAEAVKAQQAKTILPALLPATIDIKLQHIISFLKHPVEEVLKRQLGLYDSSIDDDSRIDNEPFHVTNDEIWGLTDIFFHYAVQKLQQADQNKLTIEVVIRSAIDQIRRDYQDKLPVPPYDEVALHKFASDKYQSILTELQKLLQSEINKLQTIHVSGDNSVVRTVSNRTIRLTGEISNVLIEKDRLTIIVLNDTSKTKRKLVSAIVSLLVLILSSLVESDLVSGRIILISYERSKPVVQEHLFQLTKQAAGDYIDSLLNDILQKDLTYLPMSLNTLDSKIWKKDYLTNTDTSEIYQSIVNDDEATDDTADYMNLMQLIPHEIHESIADVLRRRWLTLMKIVATEAKTETKMESKSNTAPKSAAKSPRTAKKAKSK